jgi:hypothetical protein
MTPRWTVMPVYIATQIKIVKRLRVKSAMSLFICSVICQWFTLHFGTSAVILSDMPTFAEVLNLKNNRVGMPLLNQLGPLTTVGMLRLIQT